MRYYAHFGHKDFILALGYRGDLIREYFLNYNEALSNDFMMSGGGKDIELLSRDLDDWRITFVDTGMHSNIGHAAGARAQVRRGRRDVPRQLRRRAVRPAARTNTSTSSASASWWRASWRCRTGGSFHALQAAEEGIVTSFGPLTDSAQLMINGGYFVMRPRDLRLHQGRRGTGRAPFQRLIQQRLLGVNRYHGFWQQMDTFKDKITFDRMEAQGKCPWMLWRKNGC